MKINYLQLRKCIQADGNYFARLPGAHVEIYDKEGKDFTIFFDRGASILGIAHLDTIQSSRHFAVMDIQEKSDGPVERTIFSSLLDDRIGVYALLHYLPQMGMKYDVLLTTNEESHQSTAKDWKTEKKYRWMFQVDRRGTDVVHYMYGESKEWKNALKEIWGKEVEHGSGSDICKMDHLGICGMNVGSGYDNEHSLMAKMNVDEFIWNMNNLKKFYDKYSKVTFPYKQKPLVPYVGGTYYTAANKVPDCPVCGFGIYNKDGMEIHVHCQDTKAQCKGCMQVLTADKLLWYQEGDKGKGIPFCKKCDKQDSKMSFAECKHCHKPMTIKDVKMFTDEHWECMGEVIMEYGYGRGWTVG